MSDEKASYVTGRTCRALVERTSDARLVVPAAVFMVMSGLDHLHLWDIAYRHVATLGPLFLVQTVAALVGAAVLALSRLVIVIVGSILVMMGTVVGFVLAATIGIFHFKLPVVTGWAYLALASEGLAIVTLGTALVRQVRSASVWLATPNSRSSRRAADR